MSIKSKGRKIGRMIRRMTGLHLITCMHIGKMVAQGKPETDIQKKYSDIFTSHLYRCGDQCCAYTVYTLKGSKGHVSCDYSFSENALVKEYDLHQRT